MPCITTNVANVRLVTEGGVDKVDPHRRTIHLEVISEPPDGRCYEPDTLMPACHPA